MIGRAQNFLEPEHVKLIHGWLNAYADVENYVKIASIAELKENDYNLNIPLYVEKIIEDNLIEDYAFKEASALAFVGYKREMGEVEEMLKLLRETAFKNFGASPTRMLSKSEPSSPLHELVDKALENQGIFDKLLQLFKALKSVKN
jgi:type I restriction-modification system DNA methylase subunit